MSSALRTALAYMAEDAQAAPLPDNESQFVKGMRSGTYGMGSQLNSAVGAVADSLGGDQFAQERYAEANRLRGLAGQDGPRINSLEQLGNEGYSLRNMADYGMGVMGQAVPSLAPGLIPGMMASTPLRGLIGATAAYTPMEMGDTVQRMQELQGSPTMTGEQTLQALGTGAASSVAQSIVPAVIGGKLAGKVGNPVGLTMKQAVGRNLAGIPMEGATEAGGEVIKQLGSGQGYNGQQVLEAGVAGAIGGMPMSGVGAAGDYVHGRLNQAGQAGDAAKQALEGAKSALQDAPKDLWGSAMDLAESAQKGLVESDLGKNISERAPKFSERTASFLNDPEIDPETKAKVEEMVRQGANSTNAAMMWAMEKAQEGIKASTKAKDVVAESLHQTLSRFRSPADDTADKIMRGEPLADPGVMANGSDEQVKAGLAGSAQKATEWASKKADELMGKLDPESRDALQRFGGKFDTTEAQQYVAGLAKSFDDKTGFMDKAQRLGKTVSKLAGEDGQAEVKKSADESGVYAKMREVMAPYTKDVMAAVGNDEDAMHDVGKFLHNYVSAITDTKGKRHDPIDLAMARVQLASLLGDKAAPILADIAEKFGMAGNDRDSTDRLYAELAEAEKTRGIQSDLKGLLEKSLSKEVVARNPSLQRKQGDVVEMLMSWATGKLDSKTSEAKKNFDAASVNNFLTEHYGTKGRAILRAVERAVTQMQLGTEVDEFDPNTSIADSKLSDEPTYVGKGSKGQTVLVTSAAASRSRAPQYVSDAENMMARLKEKHPGASITFRSLAEDPTLIDRIPAEKTAITKERNRLEKEYPGERAAKYREQELNAFRAGRLKELQEAGKGLFEIRQLRNEGQLSEDEDDAMRMDTDAYGHKDHPSRIEVADAVGKKHVFDAAKITKEMMRKINANREWTQEDDNLSDMSRAARAFHDGVGMLMEKYGKFDVPDDTIVYTINKKQITAGDLAKLDRRTSQDKALDLARAQLRDAQQEMKVLTDELVVAKSEDNKRLLREIANERTALNKDITRLNKFVEENSGAAADTGPDEFGENTADVNDQRDGRQDADQDGNIHMAAARLKGSKLVIQRNVDGSLKGAASRAGGYQAGKEAFPQMMTNAIEAYDTQVRSTKPGKASAALMEKVLNNVRLLSEYAPYMDPVTREKMRSILFDENGRARKVTEARDAARAMIGATTNLRAKVDANERARRANVQYEPPEPAAKGVIPENPVRFDKKGRTLAEGPTSPKVRAAQVAAKKESFLARAASGDKNLLAELKSSTDAKGLQRAVGALIKAGVAPDVIEIVNARIAELAKDPNVAYGVQTRKYSQEEVSRQFEGEAGNAMPRNSKEILDHLHKVLGDSVQVEFGKMMYAGDFTRTEMEDVIRISVHALNPMSVAHHESLHAFFAQLKDRGLPDVVNAVYKGLNSPHIMAQLRERLKHSPAALAQLSDPEERAAYAYQFYMTDPTFKIKAETRTVFEQIAAMVRKVLGIWSNDERALEIFDYFASGRYQQQSASKYAVHTALMKSGRNSAIDTANKMIAPLARLGDEIVGAGSERLRDSGIPALRELADTIKLRGTDEGRDAGYLPAARLARSEHINKLAKALNGYSQSHLAEALDALHRGDKAVSKEARTIQLITKRFLREMLTYVQQSGVGIGDLGPDYFPRVWDANYINSHREEFATMLAQYGMDDSVMEKVINDINTLPEFEAEKPGFASKNKRKLAFIEGKDAEPFLQKDFWKTMDSYITQAAHRSEWSRRFGADNEVLDTLLAKAKTQGAAEDQLHVADRYVKAVNGTLGDEIDPHFRHLQGNIIAYQNIRLLPLALFSSLVDPLGIIVRGGQVKDGWETFKRGIKELHKSWQGNPEFDAKTRLAEEIGTIEDAVLQHTISSAYGQGMMGDTAQKVNDAFFRYNFMEGFNRSVRVGATQAALGFIKRHAMGENEHSMRYLKELGLSPKQVKFDADGNVVIDEAVKRAVNRWVDGAVLRPDAADSAIWMNDPHFAVIAHLKHFAFSFHHTFLKRVWHEYQHGNYQPLMALGAFIPMMMAADFIKDIATNGGDEPAWKREWTFMDHVGYGVERSGLLGVGQFALDGLGDVKNGGTGIGALGGPAIDQIADAVSLLGGHRTFESFALRSMPANALYRGYAETGGATELEFDGDSTN